MARRRAGTWPGGGSWSLPLLLLWRFGHLGEASPPHHGKEPSALAVVGAEVTDSGATVLFRKPEPANTTPAARLQNRLDAVSDDSKLPDIHELLVDALAVQHKCWPDRYCSSAYHVLRVLGSETERDYRAVALLKVRHAIGMNYWFYTSREVEDTFALLDMDSSGDVTREELLTGLEFLSGVMPGEEQLVHEIFQLIDSDHDETVSLAELVDFLHDVLMVREWVPDVDPLSDFAELPPSWWRYPTSTELRQSLPMVTRRAPQSLKAWDGSRRLRFPLAKQLVIFALLLLLSFVCCCFWEKDLPGPLNPRLFSSPYILSANLGDECPPTPHEQENLGEQEDSQGHDPANQAASPDGQAT